MIDSYVHVLQSKIHGATVTDANVAYQGSIGIDRTLMEMAHLIPNQKVEIYNITNGNRFATYVIELPAGCGEITINGAAAHLAARGDQVIIAAYHMLAREAALLWDPALVFVNENNEVIANPETPANDTVPPEIAEGDDFFSAPLPLKGLVKKQG